MFDRQTVLKRLRKSLAESRPIIGAGAGTGISAKFAERGGADLILIYNSGRYRMNGYGSNAGLLPIGDANEIVVEMGQRDVLPIVDDTPVIAGVFGADPTRVMPRFLDTLPPMGFAGVINFPSHGYIDGEYRKSLEETGFGVDKEVDMIRMCSEKDIFTLAYCYDVASVDAFTRAGTDIVVAHMGLTTGGSIGASDGASKSLDYCIELTNAMKQSARSIRDDVIILLHGGPIEGPDDMATVMHATGTDGFIGASTMERLPVETAIQDTVAGFKSVPLSKG
ncbi:MAG: phosphoenolpyruvate hydrolase family protein [Alphaproteobacteria bacterium]|nr:phosphoenolpyruvate hydrolase family protein [Alphaproteobacteria bacterium]